MNSAANEDVESKQSRFHDFILKTELDAIPGFLYRYVNRGSFKKQYLKMLYLVARKAFKNNNPLMYLRCISVICSQVAKGDYSEITQNTILAPQSAIEMSEGFEFIINKFEANGHIKNATVVDPVNARTIRDFCTTNSSRGMLYADAGAHVYAHCVMINAISRLLKQKEDFLVGEYDLLNKRILLIGVPNFTLYIESILAIRL